MDHTYGFLLTRRHYIDHALQCIINLAETTGKEAAITQAYRNLVKELDSKDIM
jgi:hypothetical protein